MFSKNLYFLKTMAILLKIFWEKVIFFLMILTFFMAALDAQQNFLSKVIAFFVKKLPKLNQLSVIAID